MLGMLNTLGSGNTTLANQQQAQQESLAQLLQMYQQAQTDYERGSQMGAPKYIDNSGVLGVLASAFQAYRGKKLRREANETATSLADRILKAKREEEAALKAQERAQKQAEREAEIARRRQEAEAAGLAGREAQEYVYGGKFPEQKAPPSSFQEFQLSRENPDYQRFIEQRDASKGTKVTVQMPGQNYNKPFDEAIAKADVERFTKVRDEAFAAQEQLNALQALEDVFVNVKTGKPQEFYARVAQYFGAPEGATFQAQQQMVNEQVNAILNAAKGPQTDQDAIRARNAIPHMGTDPRARKVITDYLRKKLGSRISEAERMEEYLRQNRSLQGYRPQLIPFRVDASPVGGRSPADLSNEELLRELGGGR